MPTNLTQKKPINESNSFIINAIIPSGYNEISRRFITIDKENAELVRFQPSGRTKVKLGSEHVSIITSESGYIKGFTRMLPSLATGELPTKEEAKDVAINLLDSIAPDLLPSLEIHWIKPHSENISVMHQNKIVRLEIRGMKVKMRNKSDNRWMWVIVGTDKLPIVFERDIIWLTFPGQRKTEKWLHDSWLMEKNRVILS
ncbi:hypothetical protein Q5738_19970 [Citrobacter werkmanii]|uniref:hypothetical protein n=1 Tax=Citrobacter werkmanii TaxID=67827 RepID=UPI0027175C19|nr:hypothetical protein [Citrobacter werkmanii]MDO8235836.1 hypothetical protein [Citrobacter werkmanii]